MVDAGILEKRAKIIQDIFPDSYYKDSTNEIFVYCPNRCNTRKRKLQINIEKNVFQCWVCGDDLSGFIFKLLNKFATKSQKSEYCSTISFYKESEEEEQEYRISLPEEYKFIHDCRETELGKQAIEYLFQLELTYNQLLRNRIGICFSGKYFNRMIFPSYDSDVKLNYFVARSIRDGEHFKKWVDCDGGKKSKIIFNEYLIDWEKPIIIAENIKTYLKFGEEVDNIIPIFGSNSLNENYRLLKEIVFNSCPSVLVALDAEAKKKSFKFIEKLEEYDILVKYVDIEPYKQPEDMSLKDFLFRLKTSREISKQERLLAEFKL